MYSEQQITVHNGIQGQYYTINGPNGYNMNKYSLLEEGDNSAAEKVKFDIHFPVEWALNPKTNPEFPNVMTGPTFCLNCYTHCCYRGVFIAYCSNCANFLLQDPSLCIIEGETYKNITQEQLQKITYMKNVLLEEIGDEVTNENTNENIDDYEDPAIFYEEESGESEDSQYIIEMYHGYSR
jgi:hypothetical protein